MVPCYLSISDKKFSQNCIIQKLLQVLYPFSWSRNEWFAYPCKLKCLNSNYSTTFGKCTFISTVQEVVCGTVWRYHDVGFHLTDDIIPTHMAKQRFIKNKPCRSLPEYASLRGRTILLPGQHFTRKLEVSLWGIGHGSMLRITVTQGHVWEESLAAGNGKDQLSQLHSHLLYVEVSLHLHP